MAWKQISSVFGSVVKRTGHRPFNEVDSKACRTMKGLPLIAAYNPGLRIEKKFIYSDDNNNDNEMAKILGELEDLRKISFKSQETLYLNYKDPASSSSSPSSSSTTTQNNKVPVDSFRVTGRPEVSHQIKAPWGYGDDFLLENVPVTIRRVADRIKSHPSFDLSQSQLRDITINYRSNSMFKLDPHIDPSLDGANVFAIGFKSNVVFTFTPDLSTDDYLRKSTKRVEQPLKIRTDEGAICMHSWTDDDIDVLLPPGDLLHFSGDARFKWKHAIRTGLDAGPPFQWYS
jgi:hypothetical protein